MACEPLVVCGGKSIKWINLFYGIVNSQELPGNKPDTEFSDVVDSIIVAHCFGLTFTARS